MKVQRIKRLIESLNSSEIKQLNTLLENKDMSVFSVSLWNDDSDEAIVAEFWTLKEAQDFIKSIEEEDGPNYIDPIDKQKYLHAKVTEIKPTYGKKEVKRSNRPYKEEKSNYDPYRGFKDKEYNSIVGPHSGTDWEE